MIFFWKTPIETVFRLSKIVEKYNKRHINDIFFICINRVRSMYSRNALFLSFLLLVENEKVANVQIVSKPKQVIVLKTFPFTEKYFYASVVCIIVIYVIVCVIVC